MTTVVPSWRDYLALCKPKIVALIVFTAVVGMLLATPSVAPLPLLLAATTGIGLAAAAAAALNHVVDQRADALMARTRARPLPTGSCPPAPPWSSPVALAPCLWPFWACW